jgi:hypothetical protein
MVRLAAQLSPPTVTGTDRLVRTSWRVVVTLFLAASNHAFSTANVLTSSCSRRSTRARHLLLHVPVFSPPLRDGCKRAAPHLSSLASLAALPLPLCGLVHPSASHHTHPRRPPTFSSFSTGGCRPRVCRLGCNYCPALASSRSVPARLPEHPPWKTLCAQQTRPAALGFADAPQPKRHIPPRPHAPPGACAGSPRVLLIEPPYSTWLYCGCPGTKRLSCRQILLLLPETAGQGRGQTGRGSERHWGCTALQHRTILPRDFSNTARLEHAPNKTHHHHFLRRCKVLLLLPTAANTTNTIAGCCTSPKALSFAGACGVVANHNDRAKHLRPFMVASKACLLCVSVGWAACCMSVEFVELCGSRFSLPDKGSSTLLFHTAHLCVD